MIVARDRRRSDDQADLDKYKGMLDAAHRSAQDDRGAGAAADQDGEADLLASRAACTRRRPAAPRC